MHVEVSRLERIDRKHFRYNKTVSVEVTPVFLIRIAFDLLLIAKPLILDEALVKLT